MRDADFSQTEPLKARFILIGGFLGAGKTTAVAQLAKYLTGRGRRVGLITNDQGQGLVDTALLQSQGFATEEIPGGCFCCRFDALLAATQKLAATVRPEVLIAEPVGSCTDLLATVTYPLRRIYGERFTIAPVSVMVDPTRAARMFGLANGPRFSEKVQYVYRKQLEEADLIALNKCDQFDSERLNRVRRAIADTFPGKTVLVVSARQGINLDTWFAWLISEHQQALESPPLDYDTYAEGEARLGWLNATVHLSASDPFDGNAFLERLVREICNCVQGREIAHLKMILRPQTALTGVAAVSLAGSQRPAEFAMRLEEPVTGGELIVNLRAEAPPEALSGALQESLFRARAALPGSRIEVQHMERFRPARPQPTHRIARFESGA